METLKIKVSETTEKEVEIKLPYYCMGICHAYKVFSTECIQVMYGYGNGRIDCCEASIALCQETRQCTQQEFETLYNEVSEKLKLIALNK